MLAEDRRTRILEQLYATGSVRTSALVQSLNVSDVTVRADLQELERQGRLTRIRGGARTSTAELGGTFEARLMRNRSAKNRIAVAASAMVEQNRSVAFDAGTTVLALARRVPPVSGLTVITPAINIAQQLLGVEGVKVVQLGGPVDPDSVSVTWPGPRPGDSDSIVHQLFMGAHGIDSDLDIIDINPSAAIVKKRLVDSARKVVLLVDSTKFLVEGPLKVVPLSAIDVVITDDGMPSSVRKAVESAGVQLVIAD